MVYHIQLLKRIWLLLEMMKERGQANSWLVQSYYFFRTRRTVSEIHVAILYGNKEESSLALTPIIYVHGIVLDNTKHLRK